VVGELGRVAVTRFAAEHGLGSASQEPRDQRQKRRVEADDEQGPENIALGYNNPAWRGVSLPKQNREGQYRYQVHIL
jgi:hypothetical protein